MQIAQAVCRVKNTAKQPEIRITTSGLMKKPDFAVKHVERCSVSYFATSVPAAQGFLCLTPQNLECTNTQCS